MRCSQKSPICDEQVAFRYTWPGRDETYTCVEHAQGILNVAAAIGMHLQMIPLTVDEILVGENK